MIFVVSPYFSLSSSIKSCFAFLKKRILTKDDNLISYKTDDIKKEDHQDRC